MARNTFKVSIFHLSPIGIQYLLVDDNFNMECASTSYEGGILVLAQNRWSGEFRNSWPEVGDAFEFAPEGTTHLYFCHDGVVLNLPLHDASAVLNAFETPSFPKLMDDSEFAEKGYERLQEEPEYVGGSASNLFNMITECDGRLRRHVLTVPEKFELQQDVEVAYLLACGVEYEKLHSNEDWEQCNKALTLLGDTLDTFIGAMDSLYCDSLRWFENNTLAAKARVLRALRVESYFFLECPCS